MLGALMEKKICLLECLSDPGEELSAFHVHTESRVRSSKMERAANMRLKEALSSGKYVTNV